MNGGSILYKDLNIDVKVVINDQQLLFVIIYEILYYL